MNGGETSPFSLSRSNVGLQRARWLGPCTHSLDGLSAIDKVMPFAHAIGRVSNGRGSGILISLPKESFTPFQSLGDTSSTGNWWSSTTRRMLTSLNSVDSGKEPKKEFVTQSLGLFLTTSYVLPDIESALECNVTFMEKPVTGSRIRFGKPLHPFDVNLRADRHFVSSVNKSRFARQSDRTPPVEVGEETIGYSISCIDAFPTEGDESTCSLRPLASLQKKEGLHLIDPLPIPLLVSRIPTIKVGDAHLMVTHVNGQDRSYVALKVSAVHEHYCEYYSTSSATQLSSGGAVFDLEGNFVGVQHQTEVQCIALLMHSIVHRLFRSDILGLCNSPISNLPLAVLQSGGISDKEKADMYNEPFTILQSSYVMDVGNEGNQLANYHEIERVRARAGGSLTRSRVPSFEEVYAEFYDGNFETTLHMLFAFWYNSALTCRVLKNLMEPQNATYHSKVGSAGGIGIILELIDGHPEDEALVEIALAALASLCLHGANLSVFIQVNGVLSVMETLALYLHHTTIMQWGVHCLMLATDRLLTPASCLSVELFVRSNGLDLVTFALKHHCETNNDLTSWMCSLLTNVLQCNSAYVTWMHQKGLTIAVIPFLLHYRDDPQVLSGLLPFFRKVMQCAKTYFDTHVAEKMLRELGHCDIDPFCPFNGLPIILAHFLSVATTNPSFLDLLMDLCQHEAHERAPNSIELLGCIADILGVFLFFRVALSEPFWDTIDITHALVEEHLPAEWVLIKKLADLKRMRPQKA